MEHVPDEEVWHVHNCGALTVAADLIAIARRWEPGLQCAPQCREMSTPKWRNQIIVEERFYKNVRGCVWVMR